jgi:glucose-1-phosphate thymidylyltransferase
MRNKDRKGIILAGGSGTRLYPLSKSVSKQLMPVYDKPMIYYPLSTLMLSGIKDILIITKPNEKENFYNLLGNGDQLGININYAVQNSPGGIAQAFLIAEKFISNNNCTLVLGDNIFYGANLHALLDNACKKSIGASVFCYRVEDPQNYGVMEFEQEKIISISEKPKNPKSNYVVTGLYYYDDQVVDFAKSLKPSDRGELEITDINNMYLEKELLTAEFMGRGYAWLDTGSHDSLLQAGQFIATLENRQGVKICCPEEISYRLGWISEEKLLKIAEPYIKTKYGKYLKSLIDGN